MNWFVSALLTTLSWGVADLFYKKGSDNSDKLSHWKIVTAVGFVMGLHGFVYMLVNDIKFEFIWLVQYLPVAAMYIISMTLGYVGLRYIELSICSPIQNSSGALVSVLCFLILGDVMKVPQLIAVILISAGIFLLSVFEKQADNAERRINKEFVDKKYTISFLAIVFPILYCLIDAAGTFLDGIYLDSDKPILSEDAALLAYEFTFFICAVIALIYIVAVKKERFNPIRERDKFFAAIFETAGQFFYVYVIGDNAIVAAPMIASYSIVSIILSRIFLKEKLKAKQYAVIAMVMIGIAILGLYDA